MAKARSGQSGGSLDRGGGKRRWPPTPTVRAHVVLRGRGGLTATSAGLSVDNVDAALADSKTVSRAKRFLQANGFSICRVSPTSLIVEASPATYRRVFHAKPQPDSSHRVAGHRVYSWGTAPQIPDGLADDVAEIVLPKPAASFG